MTYVRRDRLDLEKKVGTALQRRHAFVVIGGPTKCGKSVLCRRVLQDEAVVPVEGGLLNSMDEFWAHLSHPLILPQSATRSRLKAWSWSGLLEVTVGSLFPVGVKGSTTQGITLQKGLTATYNNVLSLDALKELKRRDAVVVIEDFHFIPSKVQRAIVRALKTAVFDGLRVVILAVPHRAYDAAEVEDEVEGRIEYIDLPSWSLDDLLEITEKGFPALGLDIPRGIQRRICEDGFGNPLLVQEICYELSVMRIEQGPDAADLEASDLIRVYNEVARRKGVNRFEQLSHVPLPPQFPPLQLPDGSNLDLNAAMLGAVARLGPKTTITFAELTASLEQLAGNADVPQDQVEAVLSAMTRAVAKGNSAPFEWDQNRATLTITDPFLMFFLRWVLRDRRAMVLPISAIESATKIPPGIEAPSAEEDYSK